MPVKNLVKFLASKTRNICVFFILKNGVNFYKLNIDRMII